MTGQSSWRSRGSSEILAFSDESLCYSLGGLKWLRGNHSFETERRGTERAGNLEDNAQTFGFCSKQVRSVRTNCFDEDIVLSLCSSCTSGRPFTEEKLPNAPAAHVFLRAIQSPP